MSLAPPKSWTKRKLVDIADIVTGSTPSTKCPEYYGRDIPFVTPTDLDKYKPVTTTESYISNLGGEQARILPPSAVMVCCIGSLGKVGISGTNVATNQQINSLIFKNSNVFPRYVYHYCKTLKPFLVRIAPSTTVPIVNKSRFSEIEIPLPPLPEQRRIAVILDKADAIRRKRRLAIEKCEDFLRSVFLDMFINQAERSTTYLLRDIASPAPNSFVNGPFGSNLLSSELKSEGVPVIYIRDIRNGEYKRVSTVHVSSQKAKQLSFCHVESGDILIAKVGDPPGTAAVYPADEPPAIITQDVIRIKPNQKIISSEFFVSYMNSPFGQRLLRPIIIEATRSRFPLGQFKNLTIQETFSEYVAHVRRLKCNGAISLSDGENLFFSLTHLAFRGDLTNQVPDTLLKEAVSG